MLETNNATSFMVFPSINTAKSTSTGKSIFEFDKNSPVANAYNNLAKEVLENERTRQKDGTSKVR